MIDRLKFKVAFLFISTLAPLAWGQAGWNAVPSFGTNPGNLNMYSYAPAALPANAPLVVMMHGCTQNATTAATESGWNTMADRHNFYVVYPEQNAANNSSTCFNWFLPGDQSRNQGEALSVKQMVDKMRALYSIDSTRIFVTGLSAGACMTSVMLACYPEVFNKGAIVAGAPYKAASSASGASTAMSGFVTQTPAQWGNLVRAENPSYNGPWPSVAVFHGTSDPVVNINNATELVKQWTDVNGADQSADLTVNFFNGNNLVTKKAYDDPAGSSAAETYLVNSFGHAIALDTGSCYQQCGSTGTYAYDIGFSYTFWSAYFFRILTPPPGLVISGPSSVCGNSGGNSYSVINSNGSIYNWTLPPGAVFTSGQNSYSITVSFATTGGMVSLIETDLAGCENGPVDFPVSVQNCSGISAYSDDEVNVYYNGQTQNIEIVSENISHVKLYRITGEESQPETAVNGNKVIFAVNNYPVGIYIVQFTSKGRTYRKKILIDE